ncbi:MAG: branched-chain amino acid transport system II carrier protein [Atribacterota bacterium]|jgi:LIVCS family branched-chain amino acid:cation transporter|nr:branched-chain amino acid transport system II carrier protein [Atribacterota bacterium]MDD4765504.1 branched-chain amino acid transport system II carrier protein [Atribacterota bacterium]
MSKNNLLPVSVLILISGAMFSSHFGVGDLIFPPILGRGAGTSWFVAALGYMIVNSVGVWLAYLACAHQNKSLTGIASTVLGDFFGKIYTAIPILITVFFILPRVSSATHEMAILPLLPSVPLWLTLAVFFLICFYVAYTRATVMDKLGKILAPILILFVVILVIKGIATPLAVPKAPESTNILSTGMLEAYNTMNAIAALLFGGWVLHELSIRNIKGREDQSLNLNVIGFSAAVLLGITSTALVYLGASSGAFYPEAPIGVLSTEISTGLLGQVGLVSFAIIMALSCLTTAAAIISMAGDMFLEMSKGKLNYRTIVALATIAGFVLGLVGLSRIINYTVPWLVLVYPSIVVIILSGLYAKFESIKKTVAVGIIVALFFGLGDMLSFYGMTNNFISNIASRMPLGGQGIGWIIPTIIIMIIARLIFKPKTEEDITS